MADAARIAELERLLAQAQADAARLEAAAAAPAAAAAAPLNVAIDPALAAHHRAMLALTMRAQAGAAPTFAGSKAAGLEARRWLTGMLRWFARADVTADADRLVIVGTQLTGPAQVWWSSELDKDVTDPTRIATWAQFESACSARFQPVVAGSVLRLQLTTLARKHGLSVSAYTEQFLEIVAGLNDMGEADRVFQYKQGVCLSAIAHQLIPPMVAPTLKAVSEAAIRLDAHRTAAHGGGGASSTSSSSNAGRFGRFAARVTQMEAGEADSSQLDLLTEMADTIAALESRLNTMGSAPNAGRGGRSQRGGGRGGASAPGGGGGMTSRAPSLHPEPTPGLTSDMAQERIQLRLCVRCGRAGHFNRECTYDAFVTAAKNPSSN